MMRRGLVRLGQILAGTGVLGVVLCSCQLTPTGPRTGAPLSLPMPAPSALVVILGSPSAQAGALLRHILIGAAQSGEQLIVLSRSGSTLLRATDAPSPPTTQGPAFPAPPASGATSFTKAKYVKALKAARAAQGRDLLRLHAEQVRRLWSWADQAATRALSAVGRAGAARGNLASAVTEAVADLVGLEQGHVSFGSRKVIALLGGEPANPPQLQASLAGATIAVANLPTAADGAAWQASLLEAGARDVFPFTPATDGLLARAVSAGLQGDGGIAVPISGVRYGPAQYRLPASAIPALQRALHLLTVIYPSASATINGYTDDIAVPGGNAHLSLLRAEAVLDWLVKHGVEPGRLQAIGHGPTDPVAPNRSGGQPLNRRVVLIISPRSST